MSDMCISNLFGSCLKCCLRSSAEDEARPTAVTQDLLWIESSARVGSELDEVHGFGIVPTNIVESECT